MPVSEHPGSNAPSLAHSFSSLRALLAAHSTRRQSRVYALSCLALGMLVAALWVYGGLVRDVTDFTRTLPHPQVQSSTVGQSKPSVITVTVTATPSPTPALDAWRHSSHSAAAIDNTGIPRKIWQIMLPKRVLQNQTWISDPAKLKDIPSWLALNPDYEYNLIGQDRGDRFVRQYFGDNPRILSTWEKMPNVGQKSDFLRYLILSVEGGVYSDTDTVALKPIDFWVPPHLKDRVRLVVGLEFDRRDGPMWADILHEVQFCQWTIAAAPGHPVFKKMISRILTSLDDLSALHQVPLESLKPTSKEVMNSTGPAAWTDVVFEQLQEYDPSLLEPKNLSYMNAPRLIGDIYVLTIDGFGMGQKHSGSTNDGTIPPAALVKHNFNGSWRGNKRGRDESSASEP
ncbi:uncharacterized protein CTHT_0019180 [Thermochaetoides thermophila DSM 1495]|uniref:Alpha-1,6-mannosyltransferase-like protein n=1 Tax=Chaetomium thermophilum (strain DSM 1495 / CBS 144.50 / IMI 039719) TaxID=759272 RepID=G0S304_CHATD|nr:hypothetical protein CTHT_0019180 [Thermochaetoides thermophila DSM 1495]EGS22387.1 hypothetical protein CTHT_0019180 [Thermochaetoides thermophila DSM 1495]